MSSNKTRHRKRLITEQSGLCHYCKHPMTMKTGSADTCTVDHVIPKAMGGTYDRENVVGACWACNNARGDMAYDFFVAHVTLNGRSTAAPAVSPREWMEVRKRKEAERTRKREITERPGSWSAHMSARRPYLDEIEKHEGIMASAMADALERTMK